MIPAGLPKTGLAGGGLFVRYASVDAKRIEKYMYKGPANS